MKLVGPGEVACVATLAYRAPSGREVARACGLAPGHVGLHFDGEVAWEDPACATAKLVRKDRLRRARYARSGR